MITEHYANVNWMQIFPKPPACNIIRNGVKIYVKLHLMKHWCFLLDLQIAQRSILGKTCVRYMDKITYSRIHVLVAL